MRLQSTEIHLERKDKSDWSPVRSDQARESTSFS